MRRVNINLQSRVHRHARITSDAQQFEVAGKPTPQERLGKVGGKSQSQSGQSLPQCIHQHRGLCRMPKAMTGDSCKQMCHAAQPGKAACASVITQHHPTRPAISPDCSLVTS
jgi:hypothetical protein